ncbi:uncharacterized protein LOC142993559 isoform X2 [Genypterus blacodes]|uniref:uncharacterized protein LOC142993559 isoform X2 n=1 Tax=Genypterus blacodes TaxID=154954 RepID=UPI003F76EAAE
MFFLMVAAVAFLQLCDNTVAGCNHINHIDLCCDKIKSENFFKYPFSPGEDEYEIRFKETVIARDHNPEYDLKHVKNLTGSELIMKLCVNLTVKLFFKDDRNKMNENCTEYRVSDHLTPDEPNEDNRIKDGPPDPKDAEGIGRYGKIGIGIGVFLLCFVIIAIWLAIRKPFAAPSGALNCTVAKTKARFSMFRLKSSPRVRPGENTVTVYIPSGDTSGMDGAPNRKLRKDPGGQKDNRGPDVELKLDRGPDVGKQAAASVDEQGSIPDQAREVSDGVKQ